MYPKPEDVASAVQAFLAEREKLKVDAETILARLLVDDRLRSLIHSFKFRVKDESHLVDKINRKVAEAAEKGDVIAITGENVFSEIVDLAGIRLLHLHMRQMERIHPLLLEVLDSEQYIVHKAAEAKTWDPEYAKMFADMGIAVEEKESLYTSVHYVVKQNSKTTRLCEIQVRTLSEELWGETSHAINYPVPTTSLPCKEQLKVLARLVSASTRLVDSIHASFHDHNTPPTALTPEEAPPTPASQE